MKTKKIVSAIGISMMLLAGCSAESGDELEVYKALEKVADQEKQFIKEQQPMTALEEKENVLYEEILSIGMKEKEKVDEKASEALQLLDEREEHLVKEQESMQRSKEEFEKAKEKIELVKDEDIEKQANKLASLMESRYKAYDLMYASYEESVELDRELYTMFQKTNVKLNDLENQISSINEMYQKVQENSEKFNQATDAYNEEKKNFYKKVKSGQE
ncbi:YkyA family protein [Priestia flexa]|uniref:YkyA family protein n=1 Tax=Priestia flexa TaxID=86664 RepID=UPI00248FCA8B|nr:YkyA family protein [Priestia flexa]